MNAAGPRNLEPGGMYIVDEEFPCLSVSLFLGLVGEGRRGLIISSDPPEQLRNAHGIPEGVGVVWVTEAEAPSALRPSLVDQINAVRERFVVGEGGSVVLLDIFNQLVSSNDFSTVFKFFNYIRDDTLKRNSVVLVSIDSRAAEERHFRMVKRLARAIIRE
ncbi:MAG: DUF835 domain-containing protein [Thermoplasmata archaeon]